MATKTPFDELCEKVVAQYDADVILYIGSMERPYDDRFIRIARTNKRRKNILLILMTLGVWVAAKCHQDQQNVFSALVSPRDSYKSIVIWALHAADIQDYISIVLRHHFLAQFVEWSLCGHPVRILTSRTGIVSQCRLGYSPTRALALSRNSPASRTYRRSMSALL